jgi:hypothetical protein
MVPGAHRCMTALSLRRGTRASEVVPPAGFEPAIFTLKG